MKQVIIFLLFVTISGKGFTQAPVKTDSATKPNSLQAKPAGPKPYKEVITDKAISKQGLFTVHKVEDKFYFEIPDSILGREILANTRYSKTPAGASYGGLELNQQTVKFERGPNNNVFLKVITLMNTADSNNTIFQAVSNSNVNPIAAAFPIACYGKDPSANTGSVVIDVTEFFKGDNLPVTITNGQKRLYSLGALSADRSYIESIRTYPLNTEVRTIKTFSSTIPAASATQMVLSPLKATLAVGAVTFELNTSFLLLPKVPMMRRLFDPRVGFFSDQYTVYSDDQQRVEQQSFIVRFRLEPKDEDLEKYKRGELVEPKKQIVYYIDPATPKKWRPYLIAGINDWQKAFEKAGFKNAIVGKEWPENDSTMSLEDARFCVLRYFASDIENAYGPNVNDPRSGEILESHIGWFHNVMKLVHDWYFVQTAAVDPKARKMKFDDELMGNLIRFVSSHEVGHTLGLQHNMGSSSKTPVEKLRDKAWVEANGHTASIMDYARFNYVAQPEDSISEIGLFPRIGDYDKWAIQWGYKYLGESDVEKDKKINNKWIVDSLAANPRLWFGAGDDPRVQTECLGDDNVKASEYGIKNLKRIVPNLIEWTKEENDKYDNLSEMYGEIVSQFGRYMGHVAANVGGHYETVKSVEEAGNVYEPVPKAIQKNAVSFLNNQLFQTPTWLLDKNILDKITSPSTNNAVANLQTNELGVLVSGRSLYRLNLLTNRYGADKTYAIDEFLNDVQNGIFSELTTKKSIDGYRRNLQKAYVEDLIALIRPADLQTYSVAGGVIRTISININNTDIPSMARGHLSLLKNKISVAASAATDNVTKYHLQYIADRIKEGLNPKENK